MGEPLLRVVGLAKRYPRDASTRRLFKERLVSRRHDSAERWHWALQEVSFEVGSGEGLGVIGHNGAGKSTLLRLVSGVAIATRGSVERRGRLGAILTLGGGFQAELTGRENLMTAGLLSGLSRDEVLAQEDSIIEFAELRHVIDQPLRTYSTGMYLRLGFSAAIHCKPEILVVDEFLAVGDIPFQEKCLDALESFRLGGGALLLASHSLEPLRRLCQDMIVLEQGRIVERGPAGEVLARRSSP